jgi:hypothetical protein
MGQGLIDSLPHYEADRDLIVRTRKPEQSTLSGARAGKGSVHWNQMPHATVGADYKGEGGLLRLRSPRPLSHAAFHLVSYKTTNWFRTVLATSNQEVVTRELW